MAYTAVLHSFLAHLMSLLRFDEALDVIATPPYCARTPCWSPQMLLWYVERSTSRHFFLLLALTISSVTSSMTGSVCSGKIYPDCFSARDEVFCLQKRPRTGIYRSTERHLPPTRPTLGGGSGASVEKLGKSRWMLL